MRTWRANKRPESPISDPGVRHEVEPDSLPPRKEDRILSLQRSVGNMAVRGSLRSDADERIPVADRIKFESAFGEDLSEVRIHHDQEAGQLSAEAGANAFTAGRDIYFAEGMYAPQTPEGECLLAHELTHVVQQELPSAEEGNLLSEEEQWAKLALTVEVAQEIWSGV